MPRHPRLGQTLDRMPPPPMKGPDVDWQAALAAGDRTAAREALLRGGHNKGERRGFGGASRGIPGFRLARLGCGCRCWIPDTVQAGEEATCTEKHPNDGPQPVET